MFTDLLEKTGIACVKVVEWSTREEKFVKWAGFARVASLVVSDKKTQDDHFPQFLSEPECN